MSGPRAERAGIPGAGWETELVRGLEVIVPEDGGNPFAWEEPTEDERRPPRATRRATRRRKGAR